MPQTLDSINEPSLKQALLDEAVHSARRVELLSDAIALIGDMTNELESLKPPVTKFRPRADAVFAAFRALS